MNLKHSWSLLLFFCIFCVNLSFAENGGSPYSSSSSIAVTPDSLPIASQNASVAPGSEFCLDVFVADFDSIVSMQYTMTWDPAIIEYDTLVIIDVPDADCCFGYGDTNAPLGVLAISWNADQNVGWASVPDGTVLYQVCFTAVGDIGDCTSFGFSNTPLNIEVITTCSNGGDVGLSNDDGFICIVEPLELVSESMTDVDCSNPNDGSIDLSFSGGTLPLSYEWSGPNGFVDSTEDLSGLEAGIYYLTVSDSSNTQLVYLDTFEILSDFATSIAEAGADTSLNCYNNGFVTLNGAATPNNSDIVIEWYTDDGGPIDDPFSLTPGISDPGTYYLTTFNIFSNCADTSEVVVTQNTSPPFVEAGNGDELNCDQSFITLNGTDSDQGTDLDIQWTTPDGNISFGSTTLTPIVDEPGTYTLVITNEVSGCSALDSVVITEDQNVPTAVAGTDTVVTCANPEIVLDGTGSSIGNEYIYNWVTNDGIILDFGTTLNPLIGGEGTYYLIVSDLGGCSDTAIVVVDEDMTLPLVDAGPTGLITCVEFVDLLDGTNSVQGPDYVYQWTTTDGDIQEGGDTAEPVVGACGTYTLHITSLLNGCVDSASVEVLCDTVVPVSNAGIDHMLTCSETVVSLDGSASSSGPDYEYTWNTVTGNITSGQGTAMITADDGGTYVLMVEDTTNGCFALSTALVTYDTMPPLADAGMPAMIECRDPLLLDGSNSAQGDSISYVWGTTTGNIVEGENTTAPLIDAGGEYIIWVTNDLNGCAATDTVLIDGGVPLEDALLAGDFDTCGDSTTLSGNLPSGTFGEWTTSNTTLFIAEPLERITSVTNMGPGHHTFFWTLSTADCPDYHSDSLVVYVEGTPDAVEDQLDLSGYINSHVIELLENDDTSTVRGFTFDLVGSPEAGTLSTLGPGELRYDFPEGYFGMTSFDYSLCSEICPDQCDTTTVLLRISEPIDTILHIPNTITPNGDGTNDAFIIPEVKNDPDLYPDRELIVFNRWGSIVYQAKPYDNNWMGTANNGRELPQGTYYYVLRLNIGEGIIYEGDITILK